MMHRDNTMSTILVPVLLLLSPFLHKTASALRPLDIDRRKFLKNVVISGGCFVGSQCTPIIQEAHAAPTKAKGAAELDFDFYVRDLLGGNKKEGNILPSTPPPMKPPRSLKEPLVSLLLNQECSLSCVPVQALVKQINSKTDEENALIEKKVQEKVQEIRSKSSRSFATRAQWDVENLTDQYYFDLTSYALWRSAADMLPNFIDRDRFARNVGRILYEECSKNPVLLATTSTTNNKNNGNNLLSQSEKEVKEILRMFQGSQFCTGYKISAESGNEILVTGNDADNQKQEILTNVFDDLDDDAIQSGASVNCLISVYEPATLGASLQITGEQSRFMPDFVGCTLAAMWESYGIKASWETFFVDAEYRPNPKDYFPNEKLLQFTLSKKT